jgi:hypothetical protein
LCFLGIFFLKVDPVIYNLQFKMIQRDLHISIYKRSIFYLLCQHAKY